MQLRLFHPPLQLALVNVLDMGGNVPAMAERVDWLRAAMLTTWHDLGEPYTTFRGQAVGRIRALFKQSNDARTPTDIVTVATEAQNLLRATLSPSDLGGLMVTVRLPRS